MHHSFGGVYFYCIFVALAMGSGAHVRLGTRPGGEARAQADLFHYRRKEFGKGFAALSVGRDGEYPDLFKSAAVRVPGTLERVISLPLSVRISQGSGLAWFSRTKRGSR